MKQATLFSVIGILLLTFSCTKARICTCTMVYLDDGYTSINNELLGENTSIFPMKSSMKKNEETKCKSREASSSAYTRTCVLQD